MRGRLPGRSPPPGHLNTAPADGTRQMSLGTSEAVTSVEASGAKADLSADIARSMERGPDEHLRVVRVFANYYRCNWWVLDPSPHPFWLSTGTIRKSRFIQARMKDGRLLIDAETSPAVPVAEGTMPGTR